MLQNHTQASVSQPAAQNRAQRERQGDFQPDRRLLADLFADRHNRHRQNRDRRQNADRGGIILAQQVQHGFDDHTAAHAGQRADYSRADGNEKVQNHERPPLICSLPVQRDNFL